MIIVLQLKDKEKKSLIRRGFVIFMIEEIKQLGLDYAISKIECAKLILPLCHHTFLKLRIAGTTMVKIEVHTAI